MCFDYGSLQYGFETINIYFLTGSNQYNFIGICNNWLIDLLWFKHIYYSINRISKTYFCSISCAQSCILKANYLVFLFFSFFKDKNGNENLHIVELRGCNIVLVLNTNFLGRVVVYSCHTFFKILLGGRAPDDHV